MIRERNIRIDGGRVVLDGREIFRSREERPGRVFREIYRTFGMDYPKFHKMSALSKLGFLAAELVLGNVPLKNDERPPGEELLAGVDRESIAIYMANASSSLEADVKYRESMESTASPALFVYTLPNILIGEISIRHGIYGEGIFFIEEEFSKEQVRLQAMEALETGRTACCLAGWVDVEPGGNYLADIDLLLYIQ